MSQLDKWMVGGKISKLVIVITDKDTGEHVERWQFDVRARRPTLALPCLSFPFLSFPPHFAKGEMESTPFYRTNLCRPHHRSKSFNQPSPQNQNPPLQPITRKTPPPPPHPQRHSSTRTRRSRRFRPRSPLSSARSPPPSPSSPSSAATAPSTCSSTPTPTRTSPSSGETRTPRRLRMGRGCS